MKRRLLIIIILIFITMIGYSKNIFLEVKFNGSENKADLDKLSIRIAFDKYIEINNPTLASFKRIYKKLINSSDASLVIIEYTNDVVCENNQIYLVLEDTFYDNLEETGFEISQFFPTNSKIKVMLIINEISSSCRTIFKKYIYKYKNRLVVTTTTVRSILEISELLDNDNNGYITFKELVNSSPHLTQIEMMGSFPENLKIMVIPTYFYRNMLLKKLAKDFSQEKIPEHFYKNYLKIILQKSSKDNADEKKIRTLLIDYYRNEISVADLLAYSRIIIAGSAKAQSTPIESILEMHQKTLSFSLIGSIYIPLCGKAILPIVRTSVEFFETFILEFNVGVSYPIDTLNKLSTIVLYGVGAGFRVDQLTVAGGIFFLENIYLPVNFVYLNIGINFINNDDIVFGIDSLNLYSLGIHFGWKF